MKATRHYQDTAKVDAQLLQRNWEGVHNVAEEVKKIRLMGEFTMDELDIALENTNMALRLVEEETTTENLLQAENFLREAAKHLHNARVCKPSKEDLQNLIIYNQELRKQVKKTKEVRRFKI